MNNESIYHKMTFINEFLQKNKNKAGNITRGQGRILAILKRKDGISTKELASILNINISSTNELLAKLENKGFITKEQCIEDKRILLVKLTKKGFEYQLKSPESLWVFDCLDDDRKENLDRYLNEIITHIHEELKNQNPEKFQKKAEQRKQLFEKHFGKENKNSEWYNLINKY